MNIDLAPELEAVLVRAAAQRGVTPETLINDTLRERFASKVLDEPRDEWERRLRAIATDCGVSLPDSALTREEIYR